MGVAAISVILPVYNESNRLSDSVRIVKDYFSREYPSYELVIVEDDSRDNTYEIAKGLAADDRNILLIHNDKRLGRGSSLKEAILASHGDLVLYMDADIATDIRYVKNLVDSLRSGAVVATGSRLMKDSDMERPMSRDVASRAYNLFVRILFFSRVYDHQCGFKGFNKKEILPVLSIVRDNHWFWDTELLVVCQKLGLRVDEFPVIWRHNGGNNKNASKVNVLKDSYDMGRHLLGLKFRQLTEGFVIKNVNESPGTVRPQ